MPSTLVRSGQRAATELFSEAFVGLFPSIEAFEATRTFLTGDVSAYTGTVAWTSASPLVNLTIELQGPRQVGNVLQLAPGVFANWGPLDASTRAAAAAAVSADHFSASANAGDGSVSGTLEVLAIAPLRLRLDVLATSTTGEELRLEGDMAAQLVGSSLGCD